VLDEFQNDGQKYRNQTEQHGRPSWSVGVMERACGCSPGITVSVPLMADASLPITYGFYVLFAGLSF
jgi:hypothetical protein